MQKGYQFLLPIALNQHIKCAVWNVTNYTTNLFLELEIKATNSVATAKLILKVIINQLLQGTYGNSVSAVVNCVMKNFPGCLNLFNGFTISSARVGYQPVLQELKIVNFPTELDVLHAAIGDFGERLRTCLAKL